MKRIIVLVIILGFVISCASTSAQNRDSLLEDLKAENRLLKKNSGLALGENEVLKKENWQYKAEVEDLNETIQRLTDDLKALNRKYDEDMARAGEAYNSLEKTSDEKIRALTESYAVLEKKFSDEVARLNGLLEDQQKSFVAERDTMKSGFESRIKKLEEILASSERESGEKDKIIESLGKGHQEDQARISTLEKIVEDQSEKIRQSETGYQEVTLSNQQLKKEIEEKQAVIDQLTARLNELQKAAEQKAGE